MDVPGTHLVIKGDLHKVGLPNLIKDLSGVAVGEHLRGKRAEKPHYHCWLPSDILSYKDLSGVPFQEQLRNWYNDRIPNLAWKTNGNAYWAWKSHDSLERWIEYVFKTKSECKQPSVILWNLPGEPPRSHADLISATPGEGGSAADGVPVPAVVVAPSRKNLTTQDKQAKFYRYVKQYVDENPEEVLCYSDITDLLYEYSTGGFNEMAAPQYVEYAMYHYLKDTGDKVRSLEVKESWRARILSRLRK